MSESTPNSHDAASLQERIVSAARDERLVELKTAFDESARWFRNQSRNKGVGSFGRGEEWGEKILKDFLPAWFREWFEKKNWMRSALCQGYDRFWIFFGAYGMTIDQFWSEVESR